MKEIDDVLRALETPRTDFGDGVAYDYELVIDLSTKPGYPSNYDKRQLQRAGDNLRDDRILVERILEKDGLGGVFTSVLEQTGIIGQEQK